MSNHLYIVVANRRAPEQTSVNTWGEQGRLVSIQTTEPVLDAAEQAKASGARIFIYETKCIKPLLSHISQEVGIENVDRESGTISFNRHELIFRKPPFRANQGVLLKWSEDLPTGSMEKKAY